MTRLFAKVLCFLIVVCLATGYAPHGLAQSQTTGSVTGVVVDAATSQPIPNASITITNEGTGVQSKWRAGVDGKYTATLLPSGDYTITASAPGYENDSFKGFSVFVTVPGELKAPPFELRKTGAQATATPTRTSGAEGGAVLVNIINATRGGNFDTHQLLSLPLGG